MRAQDGMKLPSLPSLGLSLPPDEDVLSLEDDDLLAEEAEAPGSPALQGAAGLPPAEPPAKASCAAAAPAPHTSNGAAPELAVPAAQVSSLACPSSLRCPATHESCLPVHHSASPASPYKVVFQKVP